MTAGDSAAAEQHLDAMAEEIAHHRNRITTRQPIHTTKAREIAAAVLRRFIGDL